MVVLSQQMDILDNFSQVKKSCESTNGAFAGIPVVDLTDPDAKNMIVEACKEIGFFKVINHGVSMELISKLEDETLGFFELPFEEKQKYAAEAKPFGYGNKRIGCQGDVGWVEYLLLCTNQELVSQDSGASLIPAISESLRWLVMEYISSVRNLGCEVLEMMADGLQIKPRNILSKLIKGKRSDSCFRVNHYPQFPDPEALGGGNNLMGFGEHTDPQIISVARSNHIEGLQICLHDETWVSVPPDPSALFINVGDSLQVMTNGRFRSVKHRVLADGLGSRVSMIFFGGPPLSQTITPLASLMQEGEESSYKEFTWSEYKTSAYNTRLADNRLAPFQKS
ncbi:gibberellin 2-beta-dioxygenase-like [Henckelia pumila]|uniref:gibberellin 2-beta-dioxygenase-like n=1 Tax=Henckelia pumila TaxID=405737 RepID=UPI003C6E292D